MTRYEFVEAQSTPDEAVKFLQGTFYPLCQEFWEKKGKRYFGVDRFDIPIFEFLDMWINRKLVLIAATGDDGQARGFIVGGKLRPFFYNQTVLRIEAWFGRDEETRKGLFEHLGSIIRYIGVDRVYVPDFGDGIPDVAGFANVFEQPGRTVGR
jgi:hypothetical protein